MEWSQKLCEWGYKFNDKSHGNSSHYLYIILVLLRVDIRLVMAAGDIPFERMNDVT